MVGSALVEVCGSIIFRLTRSVAEHYDPNCVEFDPETFGFHLLESTGFEWNSHPVDDRVYFPRVRCKRSPQKCCSTRYRRLLNGRPWWLTGWTNTLFFFRSYQIIGLKRKLFLVSIFFYVLDAAYRIALQALGISSSELMRVQRIFGFLLILCFSLDPIKS